MQDTIERTIIISAVWLAGLAFVCSLALADPDLWGHTLYGLRSIDAGLLTESVGPFSFRDLLTPPATTRAVASPDRSGRPPWHLLCEPSGWPT